VNINKNSLLQDIIVRFKTYQDATGEGEEILKIL